MYTASSIKKALEANPDLSFDGLQDLNCPLTQQTWVGLKDGDCCGIPEQCREARDQTCKQRVNIFHKNKEVLYTPLFFYFTISATNNDGFIDKDDSILEKLIDRGLIDINTLVAA